MLLIEYNKKKKKHLKGALFVRLTHSLQGSSSHLSVFVYQGSWGGIRREGRWWDVCLWSVRRCRLHESCVTWSDVNVLLRASENVSQRASASRRGGDGQIIPSAWWDWSPRIDWSPNHRRKWAWKWTGLCPWCTAEPRQQDHGLVRAAARHGP